MKKSLLAGALSAFMLSNSAQAVIVDLDNNGLPDITPDTAVIYLSGASAARKMVQELYTNAAIPSAEALCDTSRPTYIYKDNGNGKEQNAFYCEINPLNSNLSAQLSGSVSNLLIMKRSAGGSAQGVNPLLVNAPIEFLKVANFNTLSTSTVTPDSGTCLPQGTTIICNYQDKVADPAGVNHADVTPDFGISDVDPAMFRGINTPAGFGQADPKSVASLLKIFGASAVVFNTPVTLTLRNALQEADFPASSVCNPTNAAYNTLVFDKNGDGVLETSNAETEACMPSLSKAQIASVFTGQVTSWDSFKFGATPLSQLVTVAANKPANANVAICRRVEGSGTQAQFNANFLRNPCANGALSPVKAQTLPFTPLHVHENSSSGGVTDCLNAYNAGQDIVAADGVTKIFSIVRPFGQTDFRRWAIGIQSLEKNANLADNFRYIKVDGIAPTLLNTVEGKYFDWAENTFQYNKTHFAALTADEQALINEAITQAGNPAVLVALNATFLQSFGENAFAAVPTSHAPEPNGIFNPLRPVTPYTHAAQGLALDNCRVPVLHESFPMNQL